MQSPAVPLSLGRSATERLREASSLPVLALRLAVVGIGLGVAGCSPMGGAGVSAGRGIAPVIDDKSGAQATNIAALTEVIKANPGDPNAYNTQGRGLCADRTFLRRDCRLLTRSRAEPQLCGGLHEPRSGVAADRPERSGSAGLQPSDPGECELRPGLSRPRKSAAHPGQFRRGVRRSFAGHQVEPGVGAGLPCPRTDLSAPGTASSGDQRLRCRH